MARKVVESTLNASTVDILNVIRQNASYEYQSQVPVISQATQIPKVGEVLYGHPALANEFINALVNRIAFVAAKSAVFYNPYRILKKGELAYGETIEEIFVDIAKVVHYDADDAVNRELRRTLPDVKAAFHAINWRVLYPVTIQQDDLARAFLDEAGVTDLITRIINQIYTAASYDEFLLFKYLLIKAVAHGEMAPETTGSTYTDAAAAFRGVSNMLPFMSNQYNRAGVRTATPRERQVIFMDARYNAEFDVNVLASAFNMDKADFMGRLYLIDDFTTFDNDRFAEIREQSDGLEEVTEAELELMANVKAILMDEDWFQVYDNLVRMTETPVNSGLYWNYFYHTWKTISSSPFANAVVFVSDTIADLESFSLPITGIDTSDAGIVITFGNAFVTVDETDTNTTLTPLTYSLVQTEEMTSAGIAVVPAGALIIPMSAAETEVTLTAKIGDAVFTVSSPIAGIDYAIGDPLVLSST